MPLATMSRPDGTQLAYEWLPGHTPVVVFLPGFASDMAGTKATTLREYCLSRGQAFLRLDYSAHGASGGDFLDGTIGIWTADAACVIDAMTAQMPILLVGSSMGGWIALLLARHYAQRLHGLLLIAPAPDFTADLIEPSLGPAQRAALAAQGYFNPPSEYGPPAPITQKLLDDGRFHLLLTAPIPISCPVRILHGMKDQDVPYQRSFLLTERLASPDTVITLIASGDHRLSSERNLQLLTETLASLLGQNAA